MNKSNNIKGEVLKSTIENCRFVPNSNYLLITVNQYESANGLEIVSEEELPIDEWQYVVAAGPASRYKPGDKVYLNLRKLIKKTMDPNDRMKMVERMEILPFELNDGKVLTFLDDNSILGKETAEDEPNLKA